jgi:soluble P-type ATPase
VISVIVPRFGELRFEHCVSDFSGTLSEDGRLLPGVRERITFLAERIRIHVLTADTHGRAGRELAGLPCLVRFLSSEDHTAEKRCYVEGLGAEGVFAIGNGNNDVGMLHAARIGVAVCLVEGCSGEAAAAADILAPTPLDALDLLLKPNRLIATLRR